MQHFVMNNFSYTSQERQQRIISDINSIILLISAYKRDQQNTLRDNIDTNPQFSALKSSQLRNQHTRQQPRRTLPTPQTYSQQQRQQYASYGRLFHRLSYDKLLYLLCRKQVLHQFVCEFIREKYQEGNLKYFGEKIVDGVREVGRGRNSPEISLQECVKNSWIEIFSKEDIFNDVIELLKSSISKNWKVNQIKVQKKLQQSMLPNNEDSKIFQTQPSLDTIQVNPSKLLTTTMKPKQMIQQSTRQILNSLQKLRRQMESCQAEMNMAKNNENRILQKNQQYSSKKKEYNELKEVYRKRTEKREQSKDKQVLRSENNKQSSTINNQSLLKKENPSKVLESNSILTKQIIDVYLNHPDSPSKLNQGEQNQSSPQSQTPPIQQNPKPKRTLQQVKQQQYDQSVLSKTIQNGFNKSLDGQSYDELIRILDLVEKNQLKNQRIGNLLSVQVETDQWKKGVSEVANAKGSRQNDLVTSSKQQFLDKYVKRVYNHYILQQSKFKNHSLFDKSLSGSQLNYQSFISENKKLLMGKKFSVQIQQSINAETNKRRMSLAQQSPPPTISQSSYLKNKSIRQRMKTVDNTRLSQQQYAQLKQPQMSIESYSKFARAFNIVTSAVTLPQVLQIFKRKSYNGRWITYNQFLEMFETVHRLECDRMGIQFTAVMFDNYLRRQIFPWERVNKVLRLKTIERNPGYNKIGNGKLKDNMETKSNKSEYKLIGHSGRLSEQIMQKIFDSKKPFDKMPCMNRNYKTLSITEYDNLPKTRIQIKIEEIKKLREIQKARKKQQLQAYLQESRTRESELLNMKQDLKDHKTKSYLKRYKMIEHKKKELNQRIQNLSKDTTQIINTRKLVQANRNNPSNSHSKASYNNSRNHGLRYNSIQSEQSQIQVEANGKRRRVRTLQPNQETIQSQKVKSRRDIIELERIIGIRESDDDQGSGYEEDFQRDQELEGNGQQYKEHKGDGRIIPNTIGWTVNNTSNHSNTKNKAKQQRSPEQNSREKSSLRKKKRPQQDEYLADYFSKQSSHISPIRYLQAGNQDLSSKFQTDSFINSKNGRQNWRVHY